MRFRIFEPYRLLIFTGEGSDRELSSVAVSTGTGEVAQ